MSDPNTGSTKPQASKVIGTELGGMRTRYTLKAARSVPAQGCLCVHMHRHASFLAVRCLGDCGHGKRHQKMRTCYRQGLPVLHVVGYCWQASMRGQGRLNNHLQ